MTGLFTKAALGAALVASAAMAAAPAEARDRYRDRDRTGTAIIAGVAGLAIGAALASGNNRRGDYYNNDGYYDRSYNGGYNQGGYYYPQQSYYNYNSYPRGYYDNYDRRYRDGRYYERKHRKWHRRHNRWDD